MSAPFDPDNRPKVGQRYKSTKTGDVYTVEKYYTYIIFLYSDFFDMTLTNWQLTDLLTNGTLIRI